MTPRAAYATACGILTFIGIMFLAGVIEWDLYPGHWWWGTRAAAVILGVWAAFLISLVTYDSPTKWVLDRERRDGGANTSGS